MTLVVSTSDSMSTYSSVAVESVARRAEDDAVDAGAGIVRGVADGDEALDHRRLAERRPARHQRFDQRVVGGRVHRREMSPPSSHWIVGGLSRSQASVCAKWCTKSSKSRR